MSLFRRSNKKTPEVTRDDVLSLLPASVRQPDRDQVLTAMIDVAAADDDSDEDVQFLESLVDSVELGKPAPKLPRTPAPSRDLTPRDDDAALSFFREAKDERERREPLHLVVPEVQIDDLVEELATTAAALRLRRAA